MKLFATLACSLALTFGLVSGSTAQSAEEPVDLGTVLATVNGTDITLAHLIALRSELPASYDQYAPDQLYEGLLEQLIIQTGLESRADTSTEMVKLSLENQRRSTLASAALEQHVASAVTDEMVETEYNEEYLARPLAIEYNASHILVEDEDTAKQIAADIRAGADFAEMAKEKSTGPSGPGGGTLGWFGRGAMVPEFDIAVSNMDVGGVSDPVQTQFGWHVIKLNETRKIPHPPLAQVAPELRQKLMTQAENRLIDEIREETKDTRAEVDIDPALVNRIDLLQ